MTQGGGTGELKQTRNEHLGNSPKNREAKNLKLRFQKPQCCHRMVTKQQARSRVARRSLKPKSSEELQVCEGGRRKKPERSREGAHIRMQEEREELLCVFPK